MNSKDFTYILQHPTAITQEQANGLQSVIDAFPYFQSARTLQLKSLKSSGSFKYNTALKITAAYTTDRSILFDFITSEVFKQNKIANNIKQNTANINNIMVKAEDISVNTPSTTNQKQDDLKIKGATNTPLFLLDKSKSIEADTISKKPKTTKEPSFTSILKLGKPLDFNINEKHSFNTWLELTKLQPIEQHKSEIISEEKNNTSKNSSISKKYKLIDAFLEHKPKLDVSTIETTTENLANVQMIQPEALMTETLARIYVEQGNYKKAIKAYQILSLKYPEKSGFFADQIKAVKHLQEINKKA